MAIISTTRASYNRPNIAFQGRKRPLILSEEDRAKARKVIEILSIAVNERDESLARYRVTEAFRLTKHIANSVMTASAASRNRKK